MRGQRSRGSSGLAMCAVRVLQVSQLASLTGQRSQIAIPAQGIIEIRDALTDLLTQFGTDDLGNNQCNT